MKSLLLAVALFGGFFYTSNEAQTNGLAISLAPSPQAAAPHAAPFLFFAVATGALFACGTAAALAGIAKGDA
jgi:hypothetical protein